MRRYTTHYRHSFYASSHREAHRYLCSLLSVEGQRTINAFWQGVEIQASLYDNRDFIRLSDGRVLTDWPESRGVSRPA